jgi:hypothetical protein
MSEEVLGPLAGSGIRLQSREDLDEFLSTPDAAEAVQASSFEQVFFTLKTLGISDSMDLLPFVTSRQIQGFVDLDCWRKDSFVGKPFMEWVAAFVQVGAEETARALSGIDADLIALFLKELITVYEIERDEPPPATQLIYSPDSTLAAQIDGTGDAATISALILDTLFKYAPGFGYGVLRRIRYTTRTELEETAYQNKVRRLDVHGFVDYYEALSIYAGPESVEAPVRPRETVDPPIPGEGPRQTLPTVFADSLSEGDFLRTAFGRVPPGDADRLAEELTALGNRILSANLVNLGEVEGIRSALGEMRDFLTIGLEHLSAGDPDAAPELLEANHVQRVFKTGFDLLAELRGEAERLARFPRFVPELLETPDQEFVAGLARFKSLLWDEGRYRNFRTLAEVAKARVRIGRLRTLSEALISMFGASLRGMTLRQAFNTALVQQAATGRFEPLPVASEVLERVLAGGVTLPRVDVPAELVPSLGDWLDELHVDLEALVGQKIDPRFVGFLVMKL